MTDKEMRELDAFIAEHVMGKTAISCNDPRPTKGTEDDYFVREWVDISRSLPFYTTDPSSAMEVLEKILPTYNGSVSIQATSNGKQYAVDSTIADTLPLAICLFAKQLFHAQEKETKVHSR